MTEVLASLKKIAHALLGDYAIYYIYACTSAQAGAPVGKDFQVRQTYADEIEASTDPVIREQAGYAGDQSIAYASFDRDRMVGVCFYWFGERYRRRNFWPLREKEAKLVQIVTVADLRGRGVATELVVASSAKVLSQGFDCVYARIWHSNTPSLRAFQRAGWSRLALVVEINPFRLPRPWRLRFKMRKQL
jgi:RimJ/RimL family protein N-acetyltransferase